MRKKEAKPNRYQRIDRALRRAIAEDVRRRNRKVNPGALAGRARCGRRDNDLETL